MTRAHSPPQPAASEASPAETAPAEASLARAFELVLGLLGKARVRQSTVRIKPKHARTKQAAPSPPAAKYRAMVEHELKVHNITVNKWRSSTSGVAMLVRMRDGSTKRLIESPEPRGPMSAAVFLHEVGHHAIGVGSVKPRCLEEYRAWAWSLAAMERHSISITDKVRERVDRSLRYAVAKAKRRGLKNVPKELAHYDV